MKLLEKATDFAITILLWSALFISFNLFTVCSSKAEETQNMYIKYGLGLNDSGPITKALFVGSEWSVNDVFSYKLETGAFDDLSQSNGIIGMFSPSIGVKSIGHGLYGKFFFGPAVITQTDTRLSSIFEFNNDVEFGIKGFNDVAIGLAYKHMSNAGIVGPNLGRDFLMLKIELPIGH